MTTRVVHFINGQEVPGAGTETSPVFQPALGEVQKEIAFATPDEVAETLAVAKAGFLKWRDVPVVRRARVLFEFNQRLKANKDKLLALISEEHGKTLEDAEGELTRGLEVVEFACGVPHLLKGDYSENVGTGVDCYSMKQPLGVCLGITPFNFPVMVPMWMFPIALACGNSFILKPSEKTPSAAVLIAKLLSESGCPDGVFNVLHASASALQSMILSPEVQAVSFVGSTPVAESVYHQAAKGGKRVQALGGAKNHCVVLPDADYGRAIDGIMSAAFGSAGERCMAISVVLAIGDEVADHLIEGLKKKLAVLKVGPSQQLDSEMGPLISQAHLNKVADYIKTGVDEGAKLVVDGRDIKVTGYETGFFLGPTLFDNVQPNMRIYQEEIFGPVLSVMRVPDLGTAIELMNSHPFGNGCAIYTRDGAHARQFSSAVQVGMVGINVPIPVPMSFYSFGGWKRSLLGDHNVHGTEGIHFYTRSKTVTSRWGSSERASALSMPVFSES